jgi:hypothetical protein
MFYDIREFESHRFRHTGYPAPVTGAIPFDFEIRYSGTNADLHFARRPMANAKRAIQTRLN